MAGNAVKGEKLEETISKMPKVIVVNILAKAVREKGGYHQVAEIAYREPPYEKATDRLSIHNLELDKFREAQIESPLTPLECWLAAICRSQDSEKSLMEIVMMDKELKAYYDADPGFAQFVDRFQIVAALPEVRKAYQRWLNDLMLDQLEADRREEAHRKEIEEVRAELMPQLALKDAELEAKDAQLDAKDAQLDAKDTQIADMVAELTALRAQLAQTKKGSSKNNM